MGVGEGGREGGRGGETSRESVSALGMVDSPPLPRIAQSHGEVTPAALLRVPSGTSDDTLIYFSVFFIVCLS